MLEVSGRYRSELTNVNLIRLRDLGQLTRPTRIDFVRDGFCGQGKVRVGDSHWLRLTEQWTATAKSVFLFDVQGTVAKSTHTGTPWLRYLRRECNRNIHFWPFDGWEPEEGQLAAVEGWMLGVV